MRLCLALVLSTVVIGFEPAPLQASGTSQAQDTADVAVSQSGQKLANPGRLVRYTLTVSNRGPGVARDVIVADTLPQGTTYVGSSAGGALAGGVVTWPTVAAHGPTDPDLGYWVDVIVPGFGGGPGVPIFNIATVATSSVDPDPSNNYSQFRTTIEGAAPDLAVVKQGPATVGGGDTIDYTISVSNQAVGLARAVQLVDSLPSSGIFISASGGAQLAGRVLTWPTIPSLRNTDPPVVFTVKLLAPAVASTLQNTARVSTSGRPEINFNNNRSTVSTRVTVPSRADIAVTKSAPDSIGLSDVFTYTLEVSNAGPDPATGIVLTDSLPPSVTVLSVSGSGSVVGTAVTWPVISSLAPKATPLRYSITVRAPGSPELLANVARVVSTTSDPDSSNNRATVVTRVRAPLPVTLTIDKVGPARVLIGDTARYTITVRNLGPGVATQVVVRDTLPPPGGSQLVRTSAGGVASPSNPRLVSWPAIPALAPGESAVYSVTLRLFAARHVNKAVANSVQHGPVADSAITRTGGPQFDAAVDKSGPATASIGDTIAYVIRVDNGGSNPTSVGLLTDSLPLGFDFVRASGGGTATPDGRAVTWTVPSLPAGGSVEDTVWVHVGQGGTFVNVGRVSASGDVDPTNNRATASTVVPLPVDLAIAKSHTGAFAVGQTGVFDVTVTNVGSSPSQPPIVVRDSLPPGLTAQSAAGTGWTVTRQGPDEVIMTYPGVLQVGESAGFRLTVAVGPAAAPSAINTAWVSAPGDSDPSNNKATDEVIVRGDPDIALTKDTASAFSVGRSGTFRFTVQNVGSNPTSGPVTFNDPLPAGLVFRSATGNGWSLAASGGTVSGTWSGVLDPGESTSFIVDVDVLPTARPCFVNVGTVSTQGDLPSGSLGANNVDSVRVCLPGELTIRKDSRAEAADVGDQVDYALLVTASGGGLIRDVQVDDQLPLGFRYVSGTTRVNGVARPDPAGAPGPVLSFQLGDIQGGDSVRITYRLLVGPGADRGDGVNRAKARSPDVDAPPGDTAYVEVRRGVFSDEGMILGKIFWNDSVPAPGAVQDPPEGVDVPEDCTCEHLFVQEGDEPGIPGVRIFLQDGTSVLTDSEGKFSFYGLSPRTWVIRVDPYTLPAGARLIPLTNRHANDGASAFVDLKSGELHRADFADASLADSVLEDVEARREQAGAFGVLGIPPGIANATGSPGATTLQTPVQGTGYQALLPEFLLTDRNSRLPAAPGLLEVPEGGGLRGRAAQPLSRPQSDEIGIEVTGPFRADGATPVPVRVTSTTGRAQTITLEATASRWLERRGELFLPLEDGDDRLPGLQVQLNASGSTYHLISPNAPGVVEIRASLDQSRTRSSTVAFAPMLRPIVASGLIEARLDLRSLTDGELGRGRDRFEDELRSIQSTSEDGDVAAGARGAAFVQGGIDLDGDDELDTELTVRVDSEEDERARLFRDIQPDMFYPVYGDAGLRTFGAQSKGRVFGQLSRGTSFLRYGDFVTAPAAFGQGGARSLGQYTRTLNGALQHFESERASVDAFASRDRFSQIVDEFRGQGISGPYALSRSDGLMGSERVELVTRDRNQPAVVLRSQVMERFTDYTIEPLSGRIVFKSPIPNADSEFNPISVRVSYEVERGGDAFWIYGANGQVQPADRFEIGGGFVRDDNPSAGFDLASVNATIELLEGKTYLVGEFARSDSASAGNGSAGRVELLHSSERLDARLFYLGTDRAFHNPSSGAARGREEMGLRSSLLVSEGTRLFAEYLRSESRFTRGRRTGGRIALDRALGRWMRAQVGYRFGEETPGSNEVIDRAPDPINAVGARLTAGLPFLPEGSIFGEFEQDVADREQRRALIGGDYRILDRARIYGRHEFISSLSGPYGLHPDLEQNNTIFGIAADYLAGQSVFSEYRGRDAFQGRDAQAAIGLRNRWSLAEGIRLSTSLERLSPLSEGAATATALTGALEFTQDSLWKATVRAEYYARGRSDNLFGSLGYARKLTDDWTFLGNTVFSTLIDGDRGFERTRLGLAYRDTGTNRWNALTRYEHRYDESPEDQAGGGTAGVSSIRKAHVFSTNLNYQPDPDVVLRGQWATKIASLDQQGLSTSERAHMLAGRGTFDVTDVLDVGLIGRTLFSSASSATQFGVGAEIGVRLADNLRLAAGYNAFGFTDEELSEDEPTDRGFYVQLGFKFDESLFGGSAPFRGVDCPECDCACPGPTVPPIDPQPDVVPKITSGPERVDRDTIILYTLTASNTGAALANDVTLSAVIPSDVEVKRPSSRTLRREDSVERIAATRGDTIRWSIGTLAPGQSHHQVLAVRVRCASTATEVLVEAIVGTSSDESNEGNNATASNRTGIGPPPCRPDPTDIAMDVSASVDTVMPGESVHFRVTTSNEGPREALNVEDIIDWTSPWPPDSIVAPLDSDSDTLSVGRDHAHTVWFTVPTCGNPTIGSIVVSGRVVSTTAETDGTNNHASDSAHISPALESCDPPGSLDLAVTIAGPSRGLPGQEIRYRVTASNTDPVVVTSDVTVTLPTGMILVRATGDPDVVGQTILWPSQALGAEAPMAETVLATCDEGSFLISAVVDTVPGETRQDNNRSATPTTCVTDLPNDSRLTLSVTGPVGVPSGTALRLNTPILFEITTTNVPTVGAGRTLGVFLTGAVNSTGLLPDHRPAFAFGNLNPARSPEELDGVIRWPGESLATNGSILDTIAVIVPGPACVEDGPRTVRIPVTVRAATPSPEGRLTGSADAVVIDTLPRCTPLHDTDVAVRIEVDSAGGGGSKTVLPGEEVRFWITSSIEVATDGELREARDVELVVPRPEADWTYVRGTIAPPWTALLSPESGSHDTARWTPAITLQPAANNGDEVVFVAPDIGEAVSLEIPVIAAIRTRDRERTLENNRDSVWITVTNQPEAPDLDIRLETLSVVGCDVTFRVTATNVGFGPADDVRLFLQLPPGSKPQRGHGAAQIGDSVFWWARGTLPVGNSTSVTVMVTFPTGPAADSVVATDSTSTPEPNLRNNRVTTVVIIQDTINLEACCQATCTVCLWPVRPWWLWLLLLIPLVGWGLYRRRRYGLIFIPCFRLFTVFRRKEINGFVSDLRHSGNKTLSSVRRIHDRVGGQPCADWEVTEELMYSYRDVRSWTAVYHLWKNAPPALRKKPKIRRLYAFALGRDDRSEDAEFELRKIVEEKGADPHTLGMLGRVYKDRWETASKCDPESENTKTQLRRAIETYRRGHESGKDNPYPGLNALTLAEYLPEMPDWAEKLREEVKAAAAEWTTEFDYWIYSTRAELAVLDRDPEAAEKEVANALGTRHVPWQAETTARNLRLIAEAWTSDEQPDPPTWLAALIGRLQAEVDAAEADEAGGTGDGLGTPDEEYPLDRG